MSEELIAILEEAMAAASRGPWLTGQGYEQEEPGNYIYSSPDGAVVVAEEPGSLKTADARFIALARNTLPGLIKRMKHTAWTCSKCRHHWQAPADDLRGIPTCPKCGPDALRDLVRKAFALLAERTDLSKDEGEWLNEVGEVFQSRRWDL